MDSQPKTLQQVIRYFSNEDTCIETVAKMRWPDGPTCPACGHKEHYYLKTQRRWKCKECWKQFSVKIGTIFEDSPLSLDKWLIAMWLIANCKNGISSCEVARDLGITQKSAWFLLHRIRKAMQDGSLVKLGGSGTLCEADETFVGGKARNMHKSKRLRLSKGTGMQGGHGKAVVMGILERGGKVKTRVIPDRKHNITEKIVRELVERGTEVHTDEFVGYYNLKDEYVHKVVNHLEGYVKENVHTNSIENFWSLLKRGLSGTYISVEPFHLFRYVDEQAYRFNNRQKPMDDSARFYDLLSRVSGKRVTYAALTGKTDDARQF